MSQGSRAQKEQKRRAVAAAKIASQGTRATARQLGCSERYVRRLAAEPETQFLIAEILRPCHAKLKLLAAQVLAVIEEALSANKTDEADHLARLKAVERYCALLQLAQGKVMPVEPKPVSKMTWEEFEVLYQARNVEMPAKGPGI